MAAAAAAGAAHVRTSVTLSPALSHSQHGKL
jgi:hypothetical protein